MEEYRIKGDCHGDVAKFGDVPGEHHDKDSSTFLK